MPTFWRLGTSSAKISRFVDRRLTVIVLANLDLGDAPPMADDVAGMFLPRKQAERDDDVATTARLGAELASAIVGAGRAGDFYRLLGELRSTEFVGEEPVGAGRVRGYRTVFERGSWVHRFTVDRAGKTTGVTLEAE